MSDQLILNKAQAEAVYSAMCALNNVGARLDAFREGEFHARELPDGRIVVHALPVDFANSTGAPEVHASQSAFADAYGLQGLAPSDGLDTRARAELVLDGDHPWIRFGDVLAAYGLDSSFVWTAETLSPYVEQYWADSNT